MSLLQQKKPYFLTQAPPPGYVPGVGRGAVGFVTRSDFGIGDEGKSGGAGNGNAMDEDDDVERGEAGENNERLFATGEYDAEDRQADLVYASFDDYMDARRKRQREEREEHELAEERRKRPKLQTQFADVKRDLSKVSYEEWKSLPESADSRQKTKWERITPAPDSLLEQAVRETQTRGTISAYDAPSGTASMFGTASVLSDVNAVGTARNTVLGSRLDAASKSVIDGTSSAIAREGYKSELDIRAAKARTIGDNKQNRELLESAVQANPTSAPSWISLARLEEDEGRLKKACKVMEQACTHCPKNKDVWLEAARLNAREPAKAVLARAVQHLPDDVDLWLAAADLETDEDRKKRVYKKALERLPTSIELWKAAVEIESPEDARLLLNQAVKCVPQSAQMWLALARLETGANAELVLNNARKAIPREKLIWIAAAQLKEAQGNDKMVRVIINKAIASLSSRGVTLTRGEWIAEAERCEAAQSLKTCEAIISETIGLGLEPVDLKSIWREDAEKCIARGHIHTARAIYTHAANFYKTKKGLWRDLALLEKQHGTRDAMLKVLETAVVHCPQADYLWVLAAKEEYTAKNLVSARQIIAKAAQSAPHSEQIWLAAAKIEEEDEKYADATALLALARQKASSGRVWMKSAILARRLNQPSEELSLLEQGTKQYPDFPKLWMMLGQYYERTAPIKTGDKMAVDEKPATITPMGPPMGPPATPMAAPGISDSDKARATYALGLKSCPGSVALWLCAIRYDEKKFGSNSARALCERGRLRLPTAPELWIEAVRIERRAGQLNAAKQLCSRALQQFSHAGLLWVELIEMEVKPADKASRFADAFKNCDTDASLIAAGARVFAEARKFKNAREWFGRAIKTNATVGDVWASYYKFELQHGTKEQVAEVIQACVAAAPKYGEKWTSISKAPENDKLSPEEILKRTALLVS